MHWWEVQVTVVQAGQDQDQKQVASFDLAGVVAVGACACAGTESVGTAARTVTAAAVLAQVADQAA